MTSQKLPREPFRQCVINCITKEAATVAQQVVHPLVVREAVGFHISTTYVTTKDVKVEPVAAMSAARC